VGIRRATVQFVSLHQVLVKWDDGSSSDLLADGDPFRVLEGGESHGRRVARGD